jgi:hypothetical protein
VAEAPDVAAVILYHFTTVGNLGMIRAHGLTRGRVELSHDPQDYVNAISLTTSPLPVGLGLDLGPDELTEVDRIRIFERTGILPAEGARFADSQAVRITVELERDDPALIRWRDFRTRIMPSRRVELERGCKPGTWWVYLGVIPPEAFTAIHYRHGTEYREEDRMG